jgi:hypothetical protein
VDARQRQDLDRYITLINLELDAAETGTSVHFDYCERPNSFYDPTDDGPESGIIRTISVFHSICLLSYERTDDDPLDRIDFGNNEDYAYSEAAL